MSRAKNSELVDLLVHLHARTDKAVLVSPDGEKSNAVWLPLSQIEISSQGGAIYEITLPEWLAIDKELA